MDPKVAALQKQLKIVTIAFALVLFLNAISAYIRLNSDKTKTENNDNLTVLLEEKAKLEAIVGIKTCVEKINNTFDINTYSQKVFACIQAEQ